MGATLVVLTLSPAGGLAKPTRQVQAIARTTHEGCTIKLKNGVQKQGERGGHPQRRFERDVYNIGGED
jgi:hypothetical protein